MSCILILLIVVFVLDSALAIKRKLIYWPLIVPSRMKEMSRHESKPKAMSNIIQILKF